MPTWVHFASKKRSKSFKNRFEVISFFRFTSMWNFVRIWRQQGSNSGSFREFCRPPYFRKCDLLLQALSADSAWRCCWLLGFFFWPLWCVLGLSWFNFGGFGRSFFKFLVFIFFTICNLFKPNIEFVSEFGTTCLHNRLCHENLWIDLSSLLRRNFVKTSLPTLRLRFWGNSVWVYGVSYRGFEVVLYVSAFSTKWDTLKQDTDGRNIR